MGLWLIPGPDSTPGESAVQPESPTEVVRPIVRVGTEAARSIVAEAYETHQRDVYSFALHSTRDAEVAADATQEAFLKLLLEVEHHGTPEHLKAWLFRVTANVIISRGRRLTVADRWAQRFGRSSAAVESPEATTLRRDHSERVQAVLGSVSVDARTCLLMAAEGFSGREIAAAIGRTELATRVLMSRARAQLRELLATDSELLEA